MLQIMNDRKERLKAWYIASDWKRNAEDVGRHA